MNNIGDRLKQERIRLGLSQAAFGHIGGVRPSAQGSYELGSRTPKADYLAKLAEAGVDPMYVLTGVRLESTGTTTRTPSLTEAERFMPNDHAGTVVEHLKRSILEAAMGISESHNSDGSPKTQSLKPVTG